MINTNKSGVNTSLNNIIANGTVGVSNTSPDYMDVRKQWVGTPYIKTTFANPLFSNTYNVPVVKSNISDLGEKFKAKRAGNKGSHVVVILDEFVTMHHLRQSTISSVNEFIEGHRKDAKETGIETTVSIFKFDGSRVIKIIDRVNVENKGLVITEDHYNPIGGTNLNDAFGSVIATINDELAGLEKSERPSIIITMITDGEENASQTFTLADVNLMVSKCQDKNWAFLFMGANIDAFRAGSQYGFNVNNTLQYAASGSGVSSSMASATRSTTMMKSMLSADAKVSTVYASAAFTDEERAKSMGECDMSTPYELRLDVLKLAKEILKEEAEINAQNLVANKINSDTKMSTNTYMISKPMVVKPVTTSEVVATAQYLYSFIEYGRVPKKTMDKVGENPSKQDIEVDKHNNTLDIKNIAEKIKKQ